MLSKKKVYINISVDHFVYINLPAAHMSSLNLGVLLNKHISSHFKDEKIIFRNASEIFT